MKIALYCTCGAAAVGTMTPDSKAKKFVEKTWPKMHPYGEGHEPCDAKTARKARQKAERGA
jgi:hypothetical protein